MGVLQPWLTKIDQYWQENQKWLPAAFFLAGFLFDLLTLDRIDSFFSLLQQGIYLLIIFFVVNWELYTEQRNIEWQGWRSHLWKYRELVVHFFLGSLLSLYTLLFFMSSSTLASFAFVFVLAALMIVNEFERIQNLGLIIRLSLFAICLLSFLSIIMPILIRHLGWLTFSLTVIASLVFVGLWIYGLKRFHIERQVLLRGIMLPLVAVHVFFLSMYIYGAIPPIPLAIKKMGIYHEIEKQDNNYVLRYERSPWLFWQDGAQSFLARPGDKIHLFVSVFSPVNFSDRVFVEWSFRNRFGDWQQTDRIPVKVVGGRDEGFRGYTFKENFEPGEWRVSVESSDGREIGRIHLDVESGAALAQRKFREEVF